MKAFQIILNAISFLFFFVLIIVGFFTISSNTSIFGNYKSWLVRSGSMEPTIMTGDIILVKQILGYNKNDVVTFKDSSDRVVTHRIIEIDESESNNDRTFITKGDANRSVDNDTIQKSNIIGKVVFIVPKVGFLVAFSKTLPGVITLIIIPASLMIIDQFIKMTKKK